MRPVPEAGAVSAGRVRSLLPNLLLLIAALGMAGVLLALIEGGLRAAGLGNPDASRTSRLAYQQVFLPILKPGVRPDGVAILHTDDPRLPYQSLLRDKPPDGHRVFVFGGSAAAGLGFSPNVTFARELGRMLSHATPDRSFEIMNLGIVALASKQVKVLVDDVSRNYDPDLLIVYSGNNEFLEIHAQEYARAHSSRLARARDLLMKTNLYRFVHRAVRAGPRSPSLASRDFSRDRLRISEDEMIEDIELTQAQIDATIADYGANLEAIADVAQEYEVDLLLLTVASNWKWRGREDLPGGWLEELLENHGGVSGAEDRLVRAREILDHKLGDGPRSERHEWLYRRALVREALGDLDAARADYRAALNEDRHLRRAVDAQNDRVRELARRRGIPMVDTVAWMASRAQHEIVGFDEFYDYVHFTPRGVVLVAEALFRELPRLGWVPPSPTFDLDAYVHERLQHLAGLSEDPFDVSEWMGFGFDPDQIRDRDLWKYDRLLEDLDRRLEAAPEDYRSRVYRGNAHFFQADGAAGAAADYRAALALEPDDAAVRANLTRLLSERVP